MPGSELTLAKAFLLGNDVAGPFNENNQTLTVTAITAGANTHGVITVGATDFAFDPDPGFVGPAIIDYAICDNGTTNGLPNGLCATSTLTVVLNGPPVAQGPVRRDDAHHAGAARLVGDGPRERRVDV